MHSQRGEVRQKELDTETERLGDRMREAKREREKETEAVVGRCSSKQVFLKISQYSLENT